MAHVYKTPSGWRAQIARRGVRLSRTFPTKSAAQQWAAREESAILEQSGRRWPQRTVSDAITAWLRGERTRPDRLRLAAFVRDFPQLAGTVISDVQPADLAAWRDVRVSSVSGGTVRRESTTLRAVWTHAAKDLGWCAWPTPWGMVRLPQDNPSRERLITWREARAILRRLYYVTGLAPRSATQAVAWAFLIGLRTGMRQGEILRLRPTDMQGSVAVVHEHKTRRLTGKPRLVPLTPAGVRLVRMLPPDGLPVSASSLDVLFRRAVQACGLDDVHFHDSRATFATHMARRVPVEVLAKITGHRDLKTLFTAYYRETADAIAERLRRAAPTR